MKSTKFNWLKKRQRRGSESESDGGSDTEDDDDIEAAEEMEAMEMDADEDELWNYGIPHGVTLVQNSKYRYYVTFTNWAKLNS